MPYANVSLDLGAAMNAYKLIWNHLKKIGKWRISFNPDPNKQAVEVTFSTKRIKTDHPDISFGGVPVVRVEEHKHLGVILDSKLSFARHIQAAITKSRQGIAMIKYLSKNLSRHTLSQLYKHYVRPHI